jgi:hypothetical protein
VIHGIEHEEITPDLTSGAYYSYDLDRTLILLRVAGRPVWISLARQRHTSDVGRKGFVLGKDAAWDYLYTGEKGVNLLGLGWVDTYLYVAFSALVFVQENDTAPRVRCGAFKWLRAGWNSMNFVKADHIRRGLERYADTFREIMEAPGLPPPSRIAAEVKAIAALNRAEIQDRARRRMQALKARYGDERQFPNGWYEDTVVNGTYLKDLSRPQLEAVLFLDYMKQVLGREPDRALKRAQVAHAGERSAP